MERRDVLIGLGALATTYFLTSDAEAASKREKSNPKKPVVQNDALRQIPRAKSPLESQIEEHIKKLRTQGRLKSDETTSFSVLYINGGEKLVAINEEVPKLSASMFKPFVGLANLHLAVYGDGNERLPYTDEVKQLMIEMIRDSDNKATNKLMDRIGKPEKIQRVLMENYGDIFKQTSIVERIPDNGRTYRNKASAQDYVRFLYALFTGALPYSQDLAEMMELKKKHPHRITPNPKTAEIAHVFNKTGSTARTCGDMGIFSLKDRNGKEHAYIVVGIIEKKGRAENYDQWVSNRASVLRDISDIIYNNVSRAFL